MSKIEKMMQEAQAWRKKHNLETLDFTKLDEKLALWQESVNQLSAAQAALLTAKATLADARKAVKAALKDAKATRKSKTKEKVKGTPTA